MGDHVLLSTGQLAGHTATTVWGGGASSSLWHPSRGSARDSSLVGAALGVGRLDGESGAWV